MNALEGIRVIDLSTSYSAPIATMQLADFGAEVIKSENVKAGDGSRSWNPCINGQSIHFLYMNRNKKSVALNLKSEEGKKILFELVKGADIVVENSPAPSDGEERPETAEPLRAVWVPAESLEADIIQAQVEAAGGNAAVLDMKNADGTLN